MHIVLFEDFLADELRPMTLTRPAFMMSCAGTSLFDAVRRLAPDAAVSWIVRSYLDEITPLRLTMRPSAPLPAPGEPVLMINALLVPRIPLLRLCIQRARENKPFWLGFDNGEGRVGAAFWTALPFALDKLAPTTITPPIVAHAPERLRLDTPFFEYPQDVVKFHPTALRENLLELLDLPPLEGEAPWREVTPGVHARGEVSIHPLACLDTTGDHGPIVLDAGVSIGPFAYLRGPLVLGPGVTITEHASIKDHCQIGARCKLGGEVSATIMESFSNKAHLGFLGHAWVGSWVNFGAGTCNSNLKNTYGDITLDVGGRKVHTGMQFLGCLVGDHSKTAINTSIFTGKIVGVSSYLYGGVGANVPSFCNYARAFGQVTEFMLDAALRTQQRMFARRAIQQTPADERLLEAVFERTRGERMMSTENLAL